jgi:uncharacterized membrane protein
MVKDIPVSKVFSLSDGIFSIAITLLVLDLIPVGAEVTSAPDFNEALASKWPVFAAFTLGFLVIASIWFDYHVLGQYFKETNEIWVWEQIFTFFTVTLIPFGVSVLGHGVNTPNMAWPVFYFGVILFARSPVTLLAIYLARRKYGGLKMTSDFPVDVRAFENFSMVGLGITTVYGGLVVCLSLINAWLALILYSTYVLVRMAPITNWNNTFKFIQKRSSSAVSK